MSPAPLPRWLLPTLRGARETLGTDLVVGLTLAAIALPGSMAAAQLVGVSPTLGLTGLLVGVIVFALVGGHRILSVGPDSTIAPLLAGGAAAAAVGTGAGGNAGVDRGALLLLSLMVAALLILIGLMRGGWITQFLSRPVTVGLLAGVGVSIIVTQLSTALGMPETTGAVPEQARQLATGLDEVNPYAAALSVTVLTVTVVTVMISPRLPGALLGLAVAAGATAAFGLTDHGVATLDEVGPVWSLPDVRAVPWSAVPELLTPALVIVVLVTVQTGATEAATRQGRTTLDRDLGVIGVASAASAVVGSFALNASPPRTRLVQDARGRSQVVGLTAGLVVLAVLFLGSGLLPLLPHAALAAVLLQIAASLIRVRELRRILRYSRLEFGVAVGTVVLVCTLGIAEGVAVAALVTLLDRTRREARPPVYRKGLMPQSNHWVPVNAGVETRQVPGVLVWSVEAPIWYADADYVVEQLREELNSGSGPYDVVVLDGAAVPDLDYTGVLALTTLVDHLVEVGTPVLVARATRSVQKALRRSGLAERVTVHPTVADAVKEGAEIAGLEAEFRAARGKKKDLRALDEAGLDRRRLLDARGDGEDADGDDGDDGGGVSDDGGRGDVQ
ncbi:SulP family inorganic anion transporter [Corynebacterium halotolerans]|uniref:Sulfate transporter n=1 Tax=Corynebacterium halotolerans YIM 70093 = DSM 44683 TaxID=1121362 RepID=M1P1T4_9CORY|nr:SulP family inorganic anion transporter [Corynebacterium halotolerans]AGF73775.1 sulfate transporter [Corynebacterium halotolerans YIM 70093 = DSM 44683]